MTMNPNNEIDNVIHQKTRLSIMATLAGVDSMDFTELKATLGLTDGNLSTHLTHLEKAEYVEIAKTFKAKKPLTTVSTTAKGKTAFQRYIGILQSIIDQAR